MLKDTDKEQNELILKNLHLVDYVVSKILPRLFMYVEKQDLVGYGVLGLVLAVKRYDPTKKVKFVTYAYRRIYGSIMNGLRLFDWLPRSLYKKRDKYHVVSSDEDGAVLEVRDFRNACPIDRLERAEGRASMLGVIRKLPKRERRLIKMYYYDGVKLGEIAKKMKVSKGFVSQLRKRALEKMSVNEDLMWMLN